ncbi:MAG: BlaI/MecI/CopY family transcriptional regulator [Acidobacteriia bacterium]|nr:BlaI/MecI/CopY family transcriptional regulator [Terriglobia bacterium]
MAPNHTSPSRQKLKPLPTKDRRRREHALFLTIQELELMKIIWESGEASVAEVRQKYQNDHPLAYTTIMTVLSRLERKGMLKQRKSGKAFYYSAVHGREALAETALDILARIFFKGSRQALIDFCRGATARPKAVAPPESKPASIDDSLL